MYKQKGVLRKCYLGIGYECDYARPIYGKPKHIHPNGVAESYLGWGTGHVLPDAAFGPWLHSKTPVSFKGAPSLACRPFTELTLGDRKFYV